MTARTALEYTHPADDLAAAVTPTLASGTAATGYDVERAGNGDPAYPFKTNETTFRLVWDFTAAVTLEFVLLVHHNFAAALAGVVFQMNGSNVWTAPAFSRAFTIAPYHEDAFPVNAWLDLRDAAPSYRYASLAVTTANVVPCAIGEVVLARQLRAIYGTFAVDVEEAESHPLVENKTDVGVSTIYAHGTRWRWLRGQVAPQEADIAVNIRAWNRATLGRGKPFVVWPHLEDDDEPLYVRWEKEELPRARIAPDGISRYQLAFEEVSRGLRPTPAAV
jgi:hypothetical protein